MAEDRVRVSPGMAETKVMVAPNSPSALAKPSTAPATSPGHASGRVMVKKRRHGDAPRVAAASSSLRSTFSMERRMVRTIRGKPMIPAASAAPVQRNANSIPNRPRNCPTGPWLPKPTSSA